MIQKTLVSRIKAGENDAWTEFAGEWERKLKGFFYTRIADKATVDDLVQDTLVSIFMALPSYDCVKPIQAFVWSIAKRRMVDHFRRVGRNHAGLVDPVEMEHIGDGKGGRWSVLDEAVELEEACILRDTAESVISEEENPQLARKLIEQSGCTPELQRETGLADYQLNNKRFEVRKKIRCRFVERVR